MRELLVKGEFLVRRELIACAVLVTSCASQASAPQSETMAYPPPSPGQGYPAAPGDSMQTPGQYPTQQPTFALPPGSLAESEAELDARERELFFMLDSTAPTPLASGDRCTTVCRALTSMQRSADHVCSLSEDRCAAARERVRKAEARAKDACPACATPT